MNITETVVNIIISYLVICGIMAIGAAVGVFLSWLAKILD
jgi:hypothetical protein